MKTKDELISYFKSWCNNPFSLEARKFHAANAFQLDIIETVTYPWLYNGHSIFSYTGGNVSEMIKANGRFHVVRAMPNCIFLLTTDDDVINYKLTEEEYIDLHKLFVSGCEGIVNVAYSRSN